MKFRNSFRSSATKTYQSKSCVNSNKVSVWNIQHLVSWIMESLHLKPWMSHKEVLSSVWFQISMSCFDTETGKPRKSPNPPQLHGSALRPSPRRKVRIRERRRWVLVCSLTGDVFLQLVRASLQSRVKDFSYTQPRPTKTDRWAFSYKLL